VRARGKQIKKACRIGKPSDLSLNIKSKQYPAIHVDTMMMQMMDVLVKSHCYRCTNVIVAI